MVTISSNGQTVTIDAFANILSASGNTAGTLTTFSSGTMVLAGGNNITLSQSSNSISIVGGAGGGGTLSMYAVSNTTLSTSGSAAETALSFEGKGAASVGISGGSVVISAPTQTNQQLSLYAVSNTTLSTSSTGNASAFSFEGAGGVSVGVSNGSVVISGGAGANTMSAYAVSNTTQSTSGTIGFSSVSFGGAGAASVGITNGSIVVSAPVESYLIAGANISLSSNSNSITIADLLTQTFSQYEPWQFGANSSASSLGQSSLYLQHFNVDDALQVCRYNRLGSVSFYSSNLAGNTNTTGTTRGNTWNYNETIGLYTRGTGANSTALYSYMSQTWSWGVTERVSFATTANATNMSIGASYSLGFVSQIDTNGGSTSGTFSTALSTSSLGTSVSIALNAFSNASAVVAINVPFGSTLLSAGDYWLAILGASAATSTGTAATQASFSNIVLTNYNSGLKQLGQTATGTAITLVPGNGAFTAQTASPPSSIPIVSVSNNSNASLYGNFMNVSL